MNDEELELWKMYDVKLRGSLTVINCLAYLGDLENAKSVYQALMKRYEEIDISKLDERFPLDVMLQTYEKLHKLGDKLQSYHELEENIQDIARLVVGFNTPRYGLYRSIVKEDERKG